MRSFLSGLLGLLNLCLLLRHNGRILRSFLQHGLHFTHDLLINSLDLLILDLLHESFEHIGLPAFERIADLLADSANLYIFPHHVHHIGQLFVRALDVSVFGYQLCQVCLRDCWLFLVYDVD